MNPDNHQRTEGLYAAGDFILASCILLFAVFVIVESIRMPIRGHLGVIMSPGFVPLFTGIMLLFLSSILVHRSIRRGGPAHVGEFFAEAHKDEENRRFLIIVLILCVYIVGLLGNVNFILATLVFHLLIFLYLKAGSLLKIILYAALGTFLVSVFLPFVFEMPMP